MFKKMILIALIAFPIYLAADSPFVDYLDGYLDVKVGNGWEPLSIGDEISADDVLRLSDNGYAEILNGSTKITLDRDGLYNAYDLMSHTNNASVWSIKGSAITKIFKTSEQDNRSSAVMGVRGDPQDEEEIVWVDDDVEFLEEGKKLYGQGKYDEALLSLEEGAEWYGTNFDEISFYKALCEYELGDPKAMRMTLDEMDPDPSASFFGDYVLFKGNVLIESRNYEKAIELFESYLDDSDDQSLEQDITFLSAFCLVELNKIDDARRKLSEVVELNRYSETGKQAASILKDM